MKTFVTGAACGIVGTSLAFWLIFADRLATPAVAAADHAPPPREVALQGASAGPTSAPQPGGAPSSPEPCPRPAALVAAPALAAPGGTSARPGAVQAPPIKLSADHAKMVAPELTLTRQPSISELHASFAAELRDAGWSSQMEQSLAQFLASANTSNEFEILAVECRSTLCELRVFGNQPNSTESWNQIGAALRQQPWWSNFQGSSTTAIGVNGRTTIITILQRAKP